VEFYDNFKIEFKALVTKHNTPIVNILSNIFTMRLIGNKTHGDLGEIGIVEFINQFMKGFKSIHVGKDRFRAKKHEEDIVVINKTTGDKFFISLKVYGSGHLQLSTNSNQQLFPFLKSQGTDIINKNQVEKIFKAVEFEDFNKINIMALIYDEKTQRGNIMVFDHKKAMKNTNRIVFIDENKKFDFATQKIVNYKGRKHPIFLFIDFRGNYICEVRYGGASANALQRGLWTHTENAFPYFDSLTNGGVDYVYNYSLVHLISLALNSSPETHKLINLILQKDIDNLKKYGYQAV